MVGGRQTLVQHCAPAVHGTDGGRQQSPDRQSTAGAAQVLPQVPQLIGSTWRFLQTPLQQVSPAPQMLPQVPQLFSSVFRFLQTPLQQSCAAPQVLPQVPQLVSSV